MSELNSAAHNNDARRVLVILTDGLPTTKGDTDVVTLAVENAKLLANDNIEVYAIGLGLNVDHEFVRNLSSDPTNTFFAPSGSDLEDIYTEITSSLCEVGPTRIEIFAKTKTNFEPLK